MGNRCEHCISVSRKDDGWLHCTHEGMETPVLPNECCSLFLDAVDPKIIVETYQFKEDKQKLKEWVGFNYFPEDMEKFLSNIVATDWVIKTYQGMAYSVSNENYYKRKFTMEAMGYLIDEQKEGING
jgi:phosphorylcholine metabolism protein LicD